MGTQGLYQPSILLEFGNLSSLQVPLQDGIRRTVEYFRKELEVAKRTQNVTEISIEPIRI